MRIAIIGLQIHPPWNEAVKNMAYELARQMTLLGNSVHIVTTDSQSFESREGVEIHTLPRRGFGRAALKSILRIQSEDGLDLVHVQNLVIHRSLAPLIWSLTKKSGLPIVAYCCQLPGLSFSDWVRVLRTDAREAFSTKLGMLAPAFATQWALRRISRTVASSNFIKSRLIGASPGVETNVIPPFLRADRLLNRDMSSNRHNGSPRLLYLGSHKALRGEKDFLLMLQIIRRQFPNLEGLAVTTFPIPAPIHRLVAKLGLQGCVRFLPRNLDLDVLSLIESSSAYVFTGMSPVGSIDPPLTIIESLILGTPVVSYDTGGISEILNEEDLVEYQDYVSLANLACRVLDKGGARTSRPELLSSFGSEAAARRFQQIYREMA